MIGMMILLAAGTMLTLAVFMAYVLGWANQAFHVEVDPHVEEVTNALPGANCGGCGCVGCSEFAEAVVAGTCPPDGCPVGGESCAKKIAEILGVGLEPSWPYRPIVHCGATCDQKLKKHEYHGERTCISANLVAGLQGCTYGCLGLGDCQVSTRSTSSTAWPSSITSDASAAERAPGPARGTSSTWCHSSPSEW